MRANLFVVAGIGALAGAGAVRLAGCGSPATVAPPAEMRGPADERSHVEMRALSARIERLEARVASVAAVLDRLAAGPVHDESKPTESRAEPSPRDETTSPVSEFAGLSSDDLEMEADERHGGSHDAAGAARRYRALLTRGGSAAQVRRWSLRLGDCLTRVGRADAALDAYRAAVDASDEDTLERYRGLCALGERAFAASDVEAALAWNDRALRSVHAEFVAQCRSVDWAKAAGRTERERAGLAFLIETYPEHPWCEAWKAWVERLDTE